MNTLAEGRFEFDSLEYARNYRLSIIREFAPCLRGEIAEIGAGIGQSTRELLALPQITKLAAVEPEEKFIAALRQALPQAEIIRGTVANLQARDFDGIVSINVLEHIQDDAAELTAYHRLLEKRWGHLCLFVPAGPEIFTAFDREVGHCRRYSRDELQSKLEAAGFTPIKLRYFNLPGYLFWWMEFRVLKRRGFNPRKVVLFDRYLFPIINLIERRCLSPFKGQSILAIARA